MNVIATIETLQSSGLGLSINSDRLCYRSKGKISEETKAFLLTHKKEVIAYLKPGKRLTLDNNPSLLGEGATAIVDVFGLLAGQDRAAMRPEEFQAAVEFFAMLAKARDEKAKTSKQKLRTRWE